jgi:uncharacterized protein (DUF433 family)
MAEMNMRTETFWSRVEKGGVDDCWPWAARRGPQGYGAFRIDGKDRRAHRVAYQLSRGPIPDGLLVRHTCDNPPCCNPNHLLLGTHADNVADRRERKRTYNLKKTHCPNGHEYSGSNLYVSALGYRGCRLCRSLAAQRSQRESRAKLAMCKVSGITRRPDTQCGRYCLAGTRMPVMQVKRMMADVGEEWILREFPWMTSEQIATAMAFRARKSKET